MVVVGLLVRTQAEDSVYISVEPDIPEYVLDGQTFTEQQFFSGEPLVIRGEFPPYELAKVQVVAKATGAVTQLDIKSQSGKELRVALPFEIPTDVYLLTVALDNNIFQKEVYFSGFDKEELIRPGGGGIEENHLSGAVLYYTNLGCRECYWESVLAGHPTDPNQLILVGATLSLEFAARATQNGGRTWSRVDLQGVEYAGDPKAMITPGGTVLLAANGYQDSPEGECATIGAFYQGALTTSFLTGTIFKQPPTGLRYPCLASDYPKIAYDPNQNTIYIISFVEFDDGEDDSALFISRDNGNTFVERRIQYTFTQGGPEVFGSTIATSMDLTLQGSPRAATHFGRHLRLIRFSNDANSFDIVAGPEITGTTVARVSATSTRPWLVGAGNPKIAIDKSPVHPGRIYAIWSKPEVSINDKTFWGQWYGKNFDIFLAHSDDDGNSWSQAEKINDDSAQADQVFPSMAIDSGGTVHIAFLDKRENPDLPQYDVYYTKIAEGRVSPNIRVNPEHVANSAGFREPGDYLDMVVAYPDKVYVSYPCGSRELVYYYATDACISAIDPHRVPFPGQFVRGDSNQDLILDISDAINTLGYLFTSLGKIPCEDAADTNDDGKIDVSDVIQLLEYLFRNDNEIPAPFPKVGNDPTADSLVC